jgi:lipopolysaccharide/colanic/teichoic acid biosynthesis glycosyltransferase
MIDSTLSFLGLVVSLPILVLAAVLIVLESPGSPIFRQPRLGQAGKIFLIYKLRTMYASTEHESATTLDDDWRVTRLGRFLRAAKIDELPQLLNILQGEMSIVGPRPLSLKEIELLKEQGFDGSYPGLCPLVRPGLIGLEQLNRTAGRSLSYAERFAFNREYEVNLSWIMDMKIFYRSLVQCRFVCYALGLGGALELLITNSLDLF